MYVLLTLSFKAARKEPLAALLQRVAAAFRDAGIAKPVVSFALADSPFPGGVSSVDRVLKRWPGFAAYLSEEPSLPGMAPVRQLTGNASDAGGMSLAELTEIAAGVPKSFPFHSISITLSASEFGPSPDSAIPMTSPGFTIMDTWWATGRRRALTAQRIVEGSIDKKSLPPLPAQIAAIAKALGSYKTMQMPLADLGAALQVPASSARSTELSAETSTQIAAICRRHRETFAETLNRADLPHDLPPAAAAMRAALDTRAERKPAGAKKAALQKAFLPLGYEVTSGSGSFTLRRRTAGNLVIEIYLDVGTWSRQLTASYRVMGLGFVARHPLVASPHDAQTSGYPIADDTVWRRLVENLAALVAEIDKTFPIEIEAAAGPSPDWFDPAGL